MSVKQGGNTIAGASTTDTANKNLSNLNSQGQNIANWSTNVTNCITEIPQDIKLELNNGTLTLKAGSKVYVPNGAGVFDVVTIASDITVSPNAGEKMFFLHPNGTQIYHANISNQIYSGTTQPSITYGFWYDTTNNVVKFTSNGSTWTSGFSLPFAKGSNTSIDQVFNGFGYIGSTVFALPGVKGLIPNGRNDDGSLNNVEFTSSSVLTETDTTGGNDDIYVVINSSGLYRKTKITYTYNKKENLNIYNGVNDYATPICWHSRTSGVISNFTPKTPFHAVDRNDSSWIAQQAMPSTRYIDLTLGASGTTYTAPANGWLIVKKESTAANQYLQIQVLNIDVVVNDSMIRSSGTSGSSSLTIPIGKGNKASIYYSFGGATNRFRFIYAEGDK